MSWATGNQRGGNPNPKHARLTLSQTCTTACTTSQRGLFRPGQELSVDEISADNTRKDNVKRRPIITRTSPAPGLPRESDLAVVGPMTRSATDLALALDVIAGSGTRTGSSYLSDRPTLQDFIEVRRHFRLPDETLGRKGSFAAACSAIAPTPDRPTPGRSRELSQSRTRQVLAP